MRLHTVAQMWGALRREAQQETGRGRRAPRERGFEQRREIQALGISGLPLDPVSTKQVFKENWLKDEGNPMKDAWRQKSGTLVGGRGIRPTRHSMGFRHCGNKRAAGGRPQWAFNVQINKQKTLGLRNRY